MARKRTEAATGQAPEGEQPTPQTTGETTPGAAGAPQREPVGDSHLEEQNPSQPYSKLEQAKKKLDRMLETNKICFRHQNDLGRIEEELAPFKYSDAELEHIMEPKGRKMIPGYSFTDIEKQRQYVNFLQSRSGKPAGGHAASEHQRQQDNTPEHER